MAEGDAKAPDGLMVVGLFKGVKDSREFDRDDGTKGTTNPKLGIEDSEGNVFQVACSPETLKEYKGKARGVRVGLHVSARGPFGSRGPVRLTVRGDEAGSDASWD